MGAEGAASTTLGPGDADRSGAARREAACHGEVEVEAEIQLPVDAFQEEILRMVRSHRVSIIVGETGCGKSSRVPLMLLQRQPSARIMVRTLRVEPDPHDHTRRCMRDGITPPS